MKEILLIKREKPLLNRTIKSFPVVFLTNHSVFTFYKNTISFQYLPENILLTDKNENRMNRSINLFKP